MHPRTDELLRHLDAHRVALREAVASVPASLRETSPGPDQWSCAEVLEHLTQVEEQVTRYLSAKLSEASAAGQLPPQPETSPIAGSLDHDVVIDRRRRVTAGERVLPRGEMDAAAALAALESARTQLRDVITSVDGLALDTFTLPHRVFGVLNGYQWFLFLGSHEARHARQIQEIGASLAPR